MGKIRLNWLEVGDECEWCMQLNMPSDKQDLLDEDQ